MSSLHLFGTQEYNYRSSSKTTATTVPDTLCSDACQHVHVKLHMLPLGCSLYCFVSVLENIHRTDVCLIFYIKKPTAVCWAWWVQRLVLTRQERPCWRKCFISKATTCQPYHCTEGRGAALHEAVEFLTCFFGALSTTSYGVPLCSRQGRHLYDQHLKRFATHPNYNLYRTGKRTNIFFPLDLSPFIGQYVTFIQFQIDSDLVQVQKHNEIFWCYLASVPIFTHSSCLGEGDGESVLVWDAERILSTRVRFSAL